MSAFELAAWNWYCGNVTEFTINSGLLPAIIANFNFKDHVREFFTRALSMIYSTMNSVSDAMAKKEAEAAHGRH